MKRIVVSSGMVLGILALAGVATAQVTLRGSQTSSSLPAASSSTSAAIHTETAAVPPYNPDAEPKAMAGMLAAQNDARARLGLPALTWSGALAAKAELTVKAAGDECARTDIRAIGEAAEASIYWSAPLRRLGGDSQAQDIRPSFPVWEWSAGRSDYDLAAGKCRRSGVCDQYARMVAPAATTVGCAMIVCSSQAQVWACQYDSASADPAP